MLKTTNAKGMLLRSEAHFYFIKKVNLCQYIYQTPNPDLGFYIYELPELLNNVIASAAKQSRFRLVSCAGLRPLRSQ
jgi:hypothetical protein